MCSLNSCLSWPQDHRILGLLFRLVDFVDNQKHHHDRQLQHHSEAVVEDLIYDVLLTLHNHCHGSSGNSQTSEEHLQDWTRLLLGLAKTTASTTTTSSSKRQPCLWHLLLLEYGRRQACLKSGTGLEMNAVDTDATSTISLQPSASLFTLLVDEFCCQTTTSTKSNAGVKNATSASAIALLNTQSIGDQALGATILHSASETGDFAVVQALLTAQADARVTERTAGWTPLHLAVKEGHANVARLLLFRNTTLVQGVHLADAADRFGWTPLLEAASHGDIQLMLLLLNAGAMSSSSTSQMLATTLGEALDDDHTDEFRSPEEAEGGEPDMFITGAIEALQDAITDARKLSEERIAFLRLLVSTSLDLNSTAKAAVGLRRRQRFRRILELIMSSGEACSLEGYLLQDTSSSFRSATSSFLETPDPNNNNNDNILATVPRQLIPLFLKHFIPQASSMRPRDWEPCELCGMPQVREDLYDRTFSCYIKNTKTNTSFYMLNNEAGDADGERRSRHDMVNLRLCSKCYFVGRTTCATGHPI
ncbi:unnamed protein product [Amoebophrya sp. A25]|nr:unnamed protein product [Amoebophrya sp. A25]|eukprot:GSA25T00019471001.1